MMAHRRRTDWVCGGAGHPVLRRHTAPLLPAARRRPQPRTALAQAHGPRLPARRRLSEAFDEAAAAWARPWRVVRTAAGLAAGDPPRGGGTSLAAPPPQRRYEDLDGARGHGANESKAVPGALPSERPAATTCRANRLRLLLACAASVLHHAWRRQTWPHTALAQAQPATVMLTRCPVAPQSPQDQARPRPHLPSSCPVKAL